MHRIPGAPPYYLTTSQSEESVHGSVHFSRSVLSDSLQPHGLQHARPPCPSTMPGVYSNSCPLSQWCHPTISSCLRTSQILLLRRHCFVKVFLLVVSKKAFFCALAWLYLLTWHPPRGKPHFLSLFLKHLCVWLHQILVSACKIPTNDGTQVSCTGRAESSPLDYQGNPQTQVTLGFLSRGWN